MIIVEPFGGLANRLRVLASAIWAMEVRNEDSLEIVWGENEELNCPLEEILEVKKSWRVKSGRIVAFSSFQVNPIKSLSFFIHGKVFRRGRVFKDKDLLDYWKDESGFRKLVTSPSRVTFSTCNFFGAYESYMSRIRIQENLVKSAEDFIQKYLSPCYIAVHIRRTDHAVAIEGSSDQAFEQVIQQLIFEKKFPIYLTTDDFTVQDKFVSLYPGKVFVRKKTLGRNKKEGIFDAVIDLVLLSKAKEIYGSKGSSFSQLGGMIGGKKVHVVGENKREV